MKPRKPRRDDLERDLRMVLDRLGWELGYAMRDLAGCLLDHEPWLVVGRARARASMVRRVAEACAYTGAGEALCARADRVGAIAQAAFDAYHAAPSAELAALRKADRSLPEPFTSWQMRTERELLERILARARAERGAESARPG